MLFTCYSCCRTPIMHWIILVDKLPTLYFSLHAERLPTSGCAAIVFLADRGTRNDCLSSKTNRKLWKFEHCHCLHVYSCCRTPITYWIIRVDKLPMLNFTLHAERLHTSCCATIVLLWIWALETIVHNLKSIANFGNLYVFLYMSMKFTWWPIFGEMCPWMDRGWARFASNYFVN